MLELYKVCRDYRFYMFIVSRSIEELHAKDGESAKTTHFVGLRRNWLNILSH